MPKRNLHSNTRLQQAFSIVELLVAVSILTLIVVVLYGVFDQTQKALRASSAQVDVLEAGRMAAELLGREMEQMTQSDYTNGVNLYVAVGNPVSAIQKMPGSNDDRTNILQDVMFLSRTNQRWFATGYLVLEADAGVGYLGRAVFTNASKAVAPTNFLAQFRNSVRTNYQPVADGIIHFRLRAYDENGFEYTWLHNTNITHERFISQGSSPEVQYWIDAPRQDGFGRVTPPNAIVSRDDRTGVSQYLFRSNAAPAYLELEMGVLDPSTLQEFKSIPNAQLQQNYLRDQAGKVHLFRQRIPIRTAPR